MLRSVMVISTDVKHLHPLLLLRSGPLGPRLSDALSLSDDAAWKGSDQ
jgi:hypothetical protein